LCPKTKQWRNNVWVKFLLNNTKMQSFLIKLSRNTRKIWNTPSSSISLVLYSKTFNVELSNIYLTWSNVDYLFHMLWELYIVGGFQMILFICRFLHVVYGFSNPRVLESAPEFRLWQFLYVVMSQKLSTFKDRKYIFIAPRVQVTSFDSFTTSGLWNTQMFG
jgi:hypothetical protein